MEYKLIAANNFTDIHTREKYIKDQELNVSEERALELFSSQNHLVRFVSREGNQDFEELTKEMETLKEENNSLKADVEKLNKEKEELVKELESNKNTDDSEDKSKNKK